MVNSRSHTDLRPAAPPREEHVITGASAAALAAAAGVAVEPLALIVVAGATIGCCPEDGGSRLATWPCAHTGAFTAIELLGPLVLLIAGATLAARRHRVWPLAAAVVASLACVVGPLS